MAGLSPHDVRWSTAPQRVAIASTRRTPWIRCASLALPITLLAGCGASYHAMYEGEVRFEHCYKLDEDPSIPLTHRRECWKEWTQFYTYGQTRDRVEYALHRQRQLGSRIENPDAGADDFDAGLGRAPTTPSPTSPFEPPPAVMRPMVADAGPSPDAATSPVASHHSQSGPEDFLDILDPSNNPPGSACMVTCGKAWRTCKGGCPAKDKGVCKAKCDTKFRVCGAKCL